MDMTNTASQKHENRFFNFKFRRSKKDKDTRENKSLECCAKSDDKLHDTRFSGQNRFCTAFKSVKNKFKNRRKSKGNNGDCNVQNTINNSDPVYLPIFISEDKDAMNILPNENTNKQSVRNDTEHKEEKRSPYNNNLSRYGYYWGSITKQEAELELQDQPDGTFLIRDSADDRHVYSLSFRSWGKTLHTRIDYDGACFSISDAAGKPTIVELVSDALEKSKDSIYFYSKSRHPIDPNYPARLTTPLSRFTRLQSLKHKCRFIIRENVNISDIERLELPETVVEYLKKPYI